MSAVKRELPWWARVLLGFLIVVFQLTANRGSMVLCWSAQCVGYNAVGLSIWIGGVWLMYSGMKHRKSLKETAKL